MLQLPVLVLYSLLLQDSVAFRVEAPATSRAGQPVPVALRLTNRTERALTLALRGRPPVFDVTVAREDGQVVWRRLEEAVVSGALTVRTLAPAESVTFEAVWDGRARGGGPPSPGRHLITGTLPTESSGSLTTRAVPLQILAVYQE
jgi:hypothetical protein